MAGFVPTAEPVGFHSGLDGTCRAGFPAEAASTLEPVAVQSGAVGFHSGP